MLCCLDFSFSALIAHPVQTHPLAAYTTCAHRPQRGTYCETSQAALVSRASPVSFSCKPNVSLVCLHTCTLRLMIKASRARHRFTPVELPPIQLLKAFHRLICLELRCRSICTVKSTGALTTRASLKTGTANANGSLTETNDFQVMDARASPQSLL